MRRFVMMFALAVAAALAAPSASQAQSVRTFLATTGSDANPCTPAAPCRTLPAAIAATASGGDVIILDSGGYGDDVLINKSISVIASPGVVARFKPGSSGYAIAINGSGIVVTLDGIGITGSGTKGVYFQSEKMLALRNMDVSVTGSTSRGIDHNAVGGILSVENSTIRNGYYCFFADSTAGFVNATIIDSKVSNCVFGFYAGGNSTVAIRRSAAVGAGKVSSVCYANFVAIGSSSGPAALSLDDIVSTGCYLGIGSGPIGGGIAAMTVSNAQIVGNDRAGGSFGSSTCKTFGNNKLLSNNTNSLEACTSIAGQ